MADSPVNDDVDRKILHALQCAPRAPFRRIGEVTGVSEQTAARRYHALRRSGVMRVIGLVNPAVYGQAHWVARIRSRPDRVGPLADSLAKRPDIAYANLASGGSEIICMIRSPSRLTATTSCCASCRARPPSSTSASTCCCTLRRDRHQ